MRKKELERRITELEAETKGLRKIVQRNCKHDFMAIKDAWAFMFGWSPVPKYCLKCSICGYEEEITEAEYTALKTASEKAALESQIAAAKEQLERLEA